MDYRITLEHYLLQKIIKYLHTTEKEKKNIVKLLNISLKLRFLEPFK